MKQKLQNFKKSAKLTFLILFILFGVLNISKAQQINIYDIYSITGENDIYVYYDLETASELTEVNYVFLDDNNQEQTISLTEGSDYYKADYYLIIYSSFLETTNLMPIQNLSFKASFDNGVDVYFEIEVTYTLYSYIYDENKNYNLSQAEDVFVYTVFKEEWEYISHVKVDGNAISEFEYEIDGAYLIIKIHI